MSRRPPTVVDGLVFPFGFGGCDLCTFPEIEIGEDAADGKILLAGDMVMKGCEECGYPIADFVDYLQDSLGEMLAGWVSYLRDKNIPLFHWSPVRHRKQIIRHGLLPDRRPNTHTFRAPYVCFSDDPARAWALSGEMPNAPEGEYDLWQTWFEHLDEPEIMPSEQWDGIHEIRTPARVYKRHLILLGSRVK